MCKKVIFKTNALFILTLGLKNAFKKSLACFFATIRNAIFVSVGTSSICST
jgi:hypothetical protein